METLPATQNGMGAPMIVNYRDPATIATLKATVAQGLTDPEFQLFAQFCQSTGLNAFKREIWAIKPSGRLQLMTGINGFWTIANDDPSFDGYEEGYVGKDGQELPHTYPKDDYIGAWCKVYRKDRKFPSIGVAFLSEYDKGHGNWKIMKRMMIMKCAESIGLRKAFPQKLNGLYTQEEMPSGYEIPTPPAQSTFRVKAEKPTVLYAYNVHAIQDDEERLRTVERLEELEPEGVKYDAELRVFIASKPIKKLKDYEYTLDEWKKLKEIEADELPGGI